MGVLDLLFPKRCLGCDRLGSYICEDCLNRLKTVKTPICPMCEKPSMFGQTHGKCQSLEGMDGLISVFDYRGIMRRMVKTYKYKYVSDLTGVLAELIQSFADFTPIAKKSWLVVGVPLHPRRERWRGFNQARELGKGIAADFGWNFAEGVINRTRYIKPQMTLSGKERRQSLMGAFALGKKGNLAKKASIVLIDDVWTTGATMRECTKVLKQGGTAEVWGLTLARAV
jgi:competence protein ComFC